MQKDKKMAERKTCALFFENEDLINKQKDKRSKEVSRV
jgi:hypothetical protein